MDNLQGKKLHNIKYNNHRAVFSALRRFESMSVGDVAREVGLSSTAVARIFGSLRQNGMIYSRGKGPSTNEGGKRPERFSLNLDYKYGIILLADTNRIGCYIFDMGYNERCSVIRECGAVSYHQYMDLCAEVILETVRKMNVAPEQFFGCCVSSPGIIDSTRGSVTYQVWAPDWDRNLPFCADLQARLPFRIDMIIENNARLSAYIEYMRDAEENGKGSMVAILGSDDARDLTPGIGGGIFNAGRIRRGINGLAGEFGHIVVDYGDDEICVCGRRGCLQTMTMPRRMIRCACERKERFPDSALWEIERVRRLEFGDLFEAADAGDALGREVVDIMVEYYARAIENIILTVDPYTVVLGGGLNYGVYFMDRLNARLKESAFLGTTGDLTLRYASVRSYQALPVSAAMYLFDRYLNDDETFHISEE